MHRPVASQPAGAQRVKFSLGASSAFDEATIYLPPRDLQILARLHSNRQNLCDEFPRHGASRDGVIVGSTPPHVALCGAKKLTRTKLTTVLDTDAL
jgi:hypothetical protein